MPRKKVVGQKLQKQLDDESTTGPRTRVRGRSLQTGEEAWRSLRSVQRWRESAWVASCDVLHALLYLDVERYRVAVTRRARETGAFPEAVEADAATALCDRAMELCKLVYAMGGTPVFVDSTSRLVREGLEAHDPWLARLMRRARAPHGAAYLAEAEQRGLAAWDAIAMLAYLCETAADDFSVMARVPRAEVLAVLWDGWDEDDELTENPLSAEASAVLRERMLGYSP